ncbi:MAG: caspase family protein, partial [Cyanobacteria bacterium J06626_6]
MKRYALVVGIGDYRYLAKLAKPTHDAQAVYELLNAHGGFNEVIPPLLDKQATVAQLKEKLRYVLQKQGEKAEVLIYFSGHGFTAGSDEYDQQGYLAAYDTQLEEGRNGELLLAKNGLSFSSINGLIADEKTNVAGLAIFLDCCQSEYLIERSLIQQKFQQALDRGVFVSAACRSFEPAWENAGDAYSAYTGALLMALGDQSAGTVTALEAHNTVEKRLKGSGQEPIHAGYGSSFVVVDYRGQGTAVPVVDEAENDRHPPYQGLQAFTRETRRFFKGRDGDVERLWQRSRQSNFVMVLGPSGMGKSSVVRAGLVARLVDEGWRQITMMPGTDPLGNLRAEVERFLTKAQVAASKRRRLMRVLAEEGLLALAKVLGEDLGTVLPAGRLLLLVDQFEEVFTQCAATELKRDDERSVVDDEKEGSEKEEGLEKEERTEKEEERDRLRDSATERRDRFVLELVAVGKAQTPLMVVATMRSDFVNEWVMTGQPPEVMDHNTVTLGPLRGENLRAAIVEPAESLGYALEPALLNLLLEDVGKEANSLPLLEFALRELWTERDREKRLLTERAYRQMGKLSGALNKRAERVYAQMASDAERAVVRRIFLRLVRIGPAQRDTRSRQRKADLLLMGGRDAQKDEQKQQMVADVIQDLVDGRLLVTGREGLGDSARGDAGYVDLSHEALLEGWERFAEWRQENRDLLRLEQRMVDAYETWLKKEDLNAKEREKYLLTGGLLAEVREQWEALSKELKERRPALMQYFADSDRKDEENVATLKRALAENNMRDASRKVRDQLQDRPAQTVDATLSAMALVGKSQDAFQGKVVYEAQDALHRAWFRIRERLKLEGHSSSVNSVAFSPQGDRIVSGSSDNTLRLWDLEGNAVGSPFEGHSSWVNSVAFSPQGDRIVSGSSDNTLRLW